jgi:dethiobiotin synthetase
MRFCDAPALAISKCFAWTGTDLLPQTLFITGTDTGVGKTLVTASFLFWLRHNGARARALKPFCSGSRADVRLLQSIQPGELKDDAVNPFFFREPVAPLVAAQRSGRKVTRGQVVKHIQRLTSGPELLLVEGAGGLLSPLGQRFTARELIKDLDASACIVAADRLGTINHTLLTVEALRSQRLNPAAVLLTRLSRNADVSIRTNGELLAKMLHPIPVLRLPYLGPRASTLKSVREHAKATSPVWEKLWETIQ